jgi:hypothetical protein
MAAKNPTGETDPAPFKVYLMTRAGRVMRASSPCERFPLRTKPSDLRVASLAGTTRCITSTGKFGPPRNGLASDHRKPDDLFVITPEMGPSFIERRWRLSGFMVSARTRQHVVIVPTRSPARGDAPVSLLRARARRFASSPNRPSAQRFALVTSRLIWLSLRYIKHKIARANQFRIWRYVSFAARASRTCRLVRCI